jgi:hypothetical protein
MSSGSADVSLRFSHSPPSPAERRLKCQGSTPQSGATYRCLRETRLSSVNSPRLLTGSRARSAPDCGTRVSRRDNCT